MSALLGVVGSVTPPGRLNAAIALAVEMAAARPGVSASLLNLADHRISFADGRSPDKFDDDTGTVVARVAAADCVLLASPVYRGTFTGALKNLLGHVEVHDASAVMSEDDEHEEDAQACGGHGEEVDGDEVLDVIGKECAPSLRGRRVALRHEPGDGALGHGDA